MSMPWMPLTCGRDTVDSGVGWEAQPANSNAANSHASLVSRNNPTPLPPPRGSVTFTGFR